LLPPYPPTDGMTSPPAPRIVSITPLTCVSDDTGAPPDQTGAHPPSDR